MRCRSLGSPLTRPRTRLSLALTAVWSGALALGVGCSEDKRADQSDINGAESDGGTAAGSDAQAPASDARTSGRGGDGSTGRGGGGGGVLGDGGDDGCNMVEVDFEPRLPTVFVLVDRSSSMFEASLWEPLKLGVLEMVERLDHQVRFGFATYTGKNGGVCPDITMPTPLSVDSYAVIKSAYDALAAPPYKGETPTARSIEQTAMLLTSDPAPGSKSILLVTDGEPDFCDDANVTCARDSVIGAVQAAQAQGIGTFIFSIGGMVDRTHLKDVANAGAGLAVEEHNNAVTTQCAASKTGRYTTPAGDAPFFEPNVNDQQLLVDTLTRVVSTTRSCLFDLQGKIRINLSEADTGIVQIDGTRIPYGAPDGFRMNSATQLELLGAACEQLKRESVERVSIDFPCEAVIAI